MSPLEATAAILAMGLVTYGTRIGGILLMSRITFSPRVEAFLRYLSGSVLVAVVVPPVIQTGPAAWFAVSAALATMLKTRHTLLSLVVGMVTAAGYRAILS
jgi:uncharacterized membrane protein